MDLQPGHSLELPEATKEQTELWIYPEFECPLNSLTGCVEASEL